MNIDRALLDKIAHLARLELKEEDVDKMLQDMNAIVAWVEKLKEVDTTGVEPLTTMSHELNVLRNDETTYPLDRSNALQQAPQKDDHFFRVPKVLD